MFKGLYIPGFSWSPISSLSVLLSLEGLGDNGAPELLVFLEGLDIEVVSLAAAS